MRKLRVWATFFRGHMTQREKEGIASSSVYTPLKKKEEESRGEVQQEAKENICVNSTVKSAT
jgi:hypothetical protein